jgi:hypothetical protein
MISFFRPEFLWVLLFVIVVIILHLIRRPTFTLLTFSTLMFFTSDAVMSSKNRRIFKLLQLIMRILAIMTIILLFARPYNKDNLLSAINDPTTPLYFWIDNTISMSYVTDSGTLSDRALNCVRKAASLKSAKTVHLFSNDAQEFSFVDDSIENEDLHYGEINFQQALHSFSDISRENGNAVLFVISDFQKQNAEYIDSIINETGRNLKNGIVLLSITPQNPYNISIHDADIQNGTVSGLLKQYGGRKDTIHLKCVVDDVDKGAAKVVSQRDSTMSFSIETGENLNINGYVQIQEHDPLLFDNSNYFTNSFRRKRKICVIGDTLVNYTIRAAIHAANNNTIINLYPERTVTFDSIDSSDVVILNAIKYPCGALNAFIMSKGTQCKSIICCVDPSEDYYGYYRDILSKAFNDGALKLQPVHNRNANPVLNDTLNDMWNKFRSFKIDNVEIYSYVTGISGTALLRYTTSDPFIIHKQDPEQRNWMIVTTSLGITVDNTLFQSSFYLPMIDRMIMFAGRLKKKSDLVLTCGKEIKNPFFNLHKENMLYDSHGNFMENLSGLSRLCLSEPGIYKVVSVNSDIVFVKVQYDSLESRIQYLSPKSIKGNKKNVLICSCEELLQLFTSNKAIGIEMFLWIFLGLFLLGEIFFSFKR